MEVWIVNVVAFRDIHSSDFSHQRAHVWMTASFSSKSGTFHQENDFQTDIDCFQRHS